MSLFSKRVLPLTLLGAAAVLGGCVGEASLEGDDGLETQAEAADPESADSIDPDAAEAVGTAQQAEEAVYYSTWWCINRAEYVGKVTIWWGHTSVDATWACNEWIDTCRNRGGCGSFRLDL
ncbi:hypothetical protein WME73_18605 [Sorangium sp. So ce302]|uniref:hypothetical protein n=1 Tax=unclassified Sorangium TaxID=2621164 RepID=UPI003F5DFF6E